MRLTADDYSGRSYPMRVIQRRNGEIVADRIVKARTPEGARRVAGWAYGMRGKLTVHYVTAQDLGLGRIAG